MEVETAVEVGLAEVGAAIRASPEVEVDLAEVGAEVEVDLAEVGAAIRASPEVDLADRGAAILASPEVDLADLAAAIRASLEVEVDLADLGAAIRASPEEVEEAASQTLHETLRKTLRRTLPPWARLGEHHCRSAPWLKTKALRTAHLRQSHEHGWRVIECQTEVSWCDKRSVARHAHRAWRARTASQVSLLK